jgi:peptidoglycan hydrolase-like protein with peptidoglycan-binding domain
MRTKAIAMAACAALLAVPPVETRASDGLVGGIVGGIVGGLIVNEANRSRQPQRTATAPRTSTSSIQREQNREVQVALNYFGFPVGAADGAIGPRSRAAIAEYQALMGFPATGQLTQYERDFLVTSYYRAQSGGAATMQEIARNPMGVRGLLLAYRDETFGRTPSRGGVYAGLPAEVADSIDEIARNANVEPDQLMQRSGFIQLADMNGDGRTDYLIDTSLTGSAFWCNANACTVRVFASTPEGYQRNDFQAFNATPALFTCQRGLCTLNSATVMASVPQPAAPQPAAPQPAGPQAQTPTVTAAAPAAPAPSLPGFLAAGVPQPSLASHCNRVSLQTTGNGGFVRVATMTDPGFALAEQFCLARTYAMSQSEELMAKVPGFTPAQIAEQCKGFGPLLADRVAAVSTGDAATAIAGMRAFAETTGVPPAQLAGTARICLGVGYTTDDMNLAIGSALLLVALGESGYGELVAHHLAQGYGAPASADAALPWYDLSLDAATAVFAPGMAERPELIRKAAYALAGRADAAAAPAPAGGAMPLFTLPGAPAAQGN